MLELELGRASELPALGAGGYSGAVVVDLFRATSTLQVLVDQGHPSIAIAGTPREAQAALARGGRCVGEWLGRTPPGFICGNSPTHARFIEPEGPPLTFLSSNGAGALVGAGRVAQVVLAGNLFNLAAVRRVIRASGGRWLLVPAGVRGRPCPEDDFVCALLAERLRGEATWDTRVTELVREYSRTLLDDLRRSPSADRLSRREAAGREDVAFILSGTRFSPVTPVYAGGVVTGRPGDQLQGA